MASQEKLKRKMSPHTSTGLGYLYTWLLQISPLWPLYIHPPSSYQCSPLFWKLINNLAPCNHVTPNPCGLHWLPIQARINFKICLLMYRVHTNPPPFCFLTFYALFIY